MDWNEIRKKLDKYYEGSSSLKDENDLIDFFSEKDVPSEFSADKETFLAISQLKGESKPSPEFSAKLNNLIDDEFEKTPVIQLNNNSKWFIGIAASILIIISAFIMQINNNDWKSDTYSNPEIAYEETRKVLEFVSATMNRNTTALNYMNTLSNSLANTEGNVNIKNEKTKSNEINAGNDLFINYISSKWPGIANR